MFSCIVWKTQATILPIKQQGKGWCWVQLPAAHQRGSGGHVQMTTAETAVVRSRLK